MAKIVAISGLGEEAQAAKQSANSMLAFGLVAVFTVGIFVGTLMIDPNAKRRRKRGR